MADRADAPAKMTAAIRRPVRYPADRPGWSWERCEAALVLAEVPLAEMPHERGGVSHRPIMLEEVLRCLQPAPGHVAVDCTLGGGSHAQAILACLRPAGRLIGIDVDAIEL